MIISGSSAQICRHASLPRPNETNMKTSAKADPLAERPDLDFSKGVRGGKYSNLLKQGTNLIILDPALLPFFPDSDSVNRALHAFLAIGDSVQSAAPTRRSLRLGHSPSSDPRVATVTKAVTKR